MHRAHKRTNHALTQDLEKLKALLVHTTEDLKGKAGEAFLDSFDNIKDKSNEVKDNLANYAAEKPLKSLMFAFLTGVTIGYFVIRK